MATPFEELFGTYQGPETLGTPSFPWGATNPFQVNPTVPGADPFQGLVAPQPQQPAASVVPPRGITETTLPPAAEVPQVTPEPGMGVGVALPEQPGSFTARPPVAQVGGSGSRLDTGRQIMDFFVQRGLTPHAAAALAGNFTWEGGGRFDLVNPNDNPRGSPGSPHSAGIAQWNDRLPALIAFARTNGIDVPTGDLRDAGYVQRIIRMIPPQTQLEFAFQELQSSEGRAFSGLTAARDLPSANAAAIGYHRPAGWTAGNPTAGHGFQGRMALAEQLLAGAGQAPQSFRPTQFTPGAGMATALNDEQAMALETAVLDPRRNAPTIGGPSAPATQAPPGASPYAAALAPGLSAALTPQPPRQVSAFGQAIDATFLGGGRPNIAQGYLDYIRGSPSGTEIDQTRQQAIAAITSRGQALRLEHPDAQPDALMRMLLRDPVFGQVGLSLGSQAPAVLAQAVNPLPVPGATTLNAGDTRIGGAGQVIAQTDRPLPAQAALYNWVQTLPPDKQAEAMAFIDRLRTPAPSDREQAQARVQAAVAAGIEPDPGDLRTAGYLMPITRVNQYGVTEVTGYQNMLTGQPVAVDPRRGALAAPGSQPAPVAPAGPQANYQPGFGLQAPPMSPAPPPAGDVGGATPTMGGAGSRPFIAGELQNSDVAGIQFQGAPTVSGQPITADILRRIQMGGGLDAGLFQPPVQPQVPVAPRASAPIDTAVRPVRLGEREFNDAPGLVVTASLLTDPAEMFLAVGPSSAARQFIGRLAGNIPGFQQSQEADQTRGAYLDQLRSAFASYQRGTRLAGEHTSQQATIPSAAEILSNPGRSLSQAIILRENLVSDLRLAMRQSSDQSLDDSTRKKASDRIAEIQNVLQHMPTLEQIYTLRSRVLSGETGNTMPGIGDITGPAMKAVDTVKGATSEPARRSLIPDDINDETRYPISRLMELSRDQRLSVPEMTRLRDELARRAAATKR